MRRNEITMVVSRPETRQVLLVDRWAFKATDKWFARAQKWAWKFLLRTRAVTNVWEDRVEFHPIRIDQQKVADRILQAMDELNIAHVRPNQVFMGPEEFTELARNPFDTFGFTVPLGHGRRVFDLPVKVIPWMRGVLVVGN